MPVSQSRPAAPYGATPTSHPDTRYALGQTSPDGKRVRTPARPAADREAPNLELVSDGGYVVDAVDYPAARMTTRAPVPRPVTADETKACRTNPRRVWMPDAQPTSSGPKQREGGHSRRIADLLIGQLASVNSCENPDAQLAHKFTGAMRPAYSDQIEHHIQACRTWFPPVPRPPREPPCRP
jgi:hypothetical protein